MTKRALRQAMRQQRRALLRQLAESKARLKAQLRASPELQRRARGRLRRRGIALLAALLALLFIERCDCAPAPPLPGPALADAGTKPPDAGMRRPALRPLDAGSIARSPRGKLGLDEPLPPGWLEQFRLQVAARSPKLADCFRGISKPGALRWSAGVNMQSGQVADHALEPVGQSVSIDPTRRECLIKALSQPVYRLEGRGEAPSTLTRISIVLEF